MYPSCSQTCLYELSWILRSSICCKSFCSVLSWSASFCSGWSLAIFAGLLSKSLKWKEYLYPLARFTTVITDCIVRHSQGSSTTTVQCSKQFSLETYSCLILDESKLDNNWWTISNQLSVDLGQVDNCVATGCWHTQRHRVAMQNRSGAEERVTGTKIAAAADLAGRATTGQTRRYDNLSLNWHRK